MVHIPESATTSRVEQPMLTAVACDGLHSSCEQGGIHLNRAQSHNVFQVLRHFKFSVQGQAANFQAREDEIEVPYAPTDWSQAGQQQHDPG